jgi:8-oxo-dGTP diphosphatase
MKRTHIVAAIILHPNQSQVFITKRPSDKHKGGYWEFPGGKVEPGESVNEAIKRELFEEVGIDVETSSPFEHLPYDYPDKSLVFDFLLVSQFSGAPFGKEGQQGEWVDITDLHHYKFPEANLPVVDKVQKKYA